jgi:hypothetical protein
MFKSSNHKEDILKENEPVRKKLLERVQLADHKLKVSEAQVIRQMVEIEVLTKLVINLEKSLSIADAQIKVRDELIAELMRTAFK